MGNIGLLLLAGGKGSRMQSSTPKQFLPLGKKMVLEHSLELFLQMEEIAEIVLVVEHYNTANKKIKIAKPGSRRQDSLANGLAALSPNIEYVCVHDAARPFITIPMIRRLIEEGKRVGAATLAMPIKVTVKEGESGTVLRTLDRSKLYEIQTPQFALRKTLEQGFAVANANNLTVTDDVSLAELVGAKVALVEGDYRNIKITTREDLTIAEAFINEVPVKNSL